MNSELPAAWSCYRISPEHQSSVVPCFMLLKYVFLRSSLMLAIKHCDARPCSNSNDCNQNQHPASTRPYHGCGGFMLWSQKMGWPALVVGRDGLSGVIGRTGGAALLRINCMRFGG